MKEYIEREALLSEINYKNEMMKTSFLKQSLCVGDIIHCINSAPVADVAPAKHGTWETVHGVLTPGGDPLKRCPFCRSRESEHLDGVEHYCHWNFCPTCGANMSGGNK